MSTPEKPRRWFQIHLSTAMVLMLELGGLMWLNNVAGILRPHTLKVILGSHEGISREKFESVGWPLKIYDNYAVSVTKIDSSHPELGGLSFRYDMREVTLKYYINFSVAIILLLSTAFLFQRRIRANPKSKMGRDPKSEESTVH